MPPKRRNFYGPDEPATPTVREQRVADTLESQISARRTISTDIPIERIRPNPFQARRQFSDLEELADAIRAQGFTSRLRVRPDPTEQGYFQLVYGERRLRAAKLAGLASVPCDVADHSDAELIEIGLAENIQRHDLRPLEEAQSFQLMLDQRGYSVRSLAERIGKDPSYINDRLLLLRIPDDLQQMVDQRPDTLRLARELAKIPLAEVREPIIAGVVEGVLSLAAVRKLIQERDQPAEEAGRVDEIVDEEPHTAPMQQPQLSEPAHKAQQPEPKAAAGQRDYERDLHTIRVVLTHWRYALEHEEERSKVARYLQIVTQEAEELQRLLEEE